MYYVYYIFMGAEHAAYLVENILIFFEKHSCVFVYANNDVVFSVAGSSEFYTRLLIQLLDHVF